MADIAKLIGIDIGDVSKFMNVDMDNVASIMGLSISAGVGDRGVYGGGYTSTNVNVIDYVTISTTGNTTDFGDLTSNRMRCGSTSNGVNDRGIWAGNYYFSPGFVNTIDYVTISSPGNAQDFGDLTNNASGSQGSSNGTSNRGVFAGGEVANGSYVNVIQYVTISSLGNAADFGDCEYSVGRQGDAAASNGTNNRMVFKRRNAAAYNGVSYITITSAGNASDFGDLTLGRNNFTATSNTTNDRGVWLGGNNVTVYNVIDYLTISSTGNATNFGDLTVARFDSSAVSNGTNNTAVNSGGYTSSLVNVIDYFTISSTGDASDFGDVVSARRTHSAASNA